MFVAAALGKESFFWHKLHSLTGVMPVGFYMVQHLTLNSFSLVSADKYNGVSDFFYSMPEHILLAIEVFMVWVPLLFHMVYGGFMAQRAQSNYLTTKYKWSQNLMFFLQRASGLFLVAFLIFHFCTTTLQIKRLGSHEVVSYAAMRAQLSQFSYLMLVFYMLGVLAASYHLCFGLWNFCIRWGITISEQAQVRVQKMSLGLFVAITALGWAALFGFFRPEPQQLMQASHSGHIAVAQR